jgi:hypothetical protein
MRLRALLLVALIPSVALAQDGKKPPKATKISYQYDAFHHVMARPIARSLDPSILVRRITGKEREAANVDEQDQVRLPSTWWQPRAGFVPVSVAEMLAGPGPGTGPNRATKWRVSGLKTQGVSVGFRIKDADGQTFQLKFDPPAYPEMASGADVVTTYLMWAAGYNVPDNTIVHFTLDDLEIPQNATYENIVGQKKTLDRAKLEGLLKGVPIRADGSYRAVASRFLKGKPLGEWLYWGRRKDDPEDLIPHQLRREVRGLWTVVAWVNNDDASARNTLDMWVDEGGRQFVRHYLIDFSSCLGSASADKHGLRTGHDYGLDYGAIAQSTLTLGLYRPGWERGKDPNLPGAGYLESDTFNPSGWRPLLPNPAFDERTDRDARWGARIVAGFTDEMIRAAVERGKYSDPKVAEYLVEALIERRDKIVKHWAPGASARR